MSQFQKPDWPGIKEGERYYFSDDGSDTWKFWEWCLIKGAPRLFEIMADHLFGGGLPLATSLTADQMRDFVRGLMADPRCEELTIRALPPQGEWVLGGGKINV